MTETIACALTWSTNGWTGPLERKAGDATLGEYVDEGRWGGEDWAFATGPGQLIDGRLYCYAHGKPSPERVAASKGVFNVVFFSRDPSNRVCLVGAYRNARFVADDDVPDAWARMKSARVVARRVKQLKAAFGDPIQGAAAAAQFVKETPVRWVVRASDVLVFHSRPSFAEPSLHPNNAHFVSKMAPAVQAQLAQLLAKDPKTDSDASEREAAGFPPSAGKGAAEGEKKERLHLFRERNGRLVREFKASKVNHEPEPHYTCEACDRSYLPELRTYATKVFDVHHQVPLAEAKGKRVTEWTELAILCATCHRLAHASGLFKVTELRAFLKNPK